MWAGLTSPDYEFAGGAVRHKASGIALSLPDPVPFNTTPNPHVLSLPGKPIPIAWLLIWNIPNSGRARQMGEPYETAGDRERFRRRFGALSELQSITYAAPNVSFPWDAGLVEVLCDLYFVSIDFPRFFNGREAYPDVLELEALELPAGLRGRVTNKYGQARS